MNKQNEKKKGWKPFIIIWVLLVITGIALCSVGLVGLFKNGSFDFNAFNYTVGTKGKYEYTSYEYISDPEIINDITLDFINRKITVLESSGEYSSKIALVCQVTQYDNIDVNESGHSLTVRQSNQDAFELFSLDLSYLFGEKDNNNVILYIPADYIGSLDIKTSNSSIECKKFELLRSVSLISSNGSITASNLTLETLLVKTSNAPIKLSEIISDKTEADTSNGKITAESVRAHDSLLLTTSNAAVSVNDIDSNDIYLKSSNGKISGIIAGSASDFTVKSDTSNGSDSLENIRGNGYKKLEVKTNNSPIDIRFDK